MGFFSKKIKNQDEVFQRLSQRDKKVSEKAKSEFISCLNSDHIVYLVKKFKESKIISEKECLFIASKLMFENETLYSKGEAKLMDIKNYLEKVSKEEEFIIVDHQIVNKENNVNEYEEMLNECFLDATNELIQETRHFDEETMTTHSARCVAHLRLQYR